MTQLDRIEKDIAEVKAMLKEILASKGMLDDFINALHSLAAEIEKDSLSEVGRDNF